MASFCRKEHFLNICFWDGLSLRSTSFWKVRVYGLPPLWFCREKCLSPLSKKRFEFMIYLLLDGLSFWSISIFHSSLFFPFFSFFWVFISSVSSVHSFFPALCSLSFSFILSVLFLLSYLCFEQVQFIQSSLLAFEQRKQGRRKRKKRRGEKQNKDKRKRMKKKLRRIYWNVFYPSLFCFSFAKPLPQKCQKIPGNQFYSLFPFFVGLVFWLVGWVCCQPQQQPTQPQQQKQEAKEQNKTKEGLGCCWARVTLNLPKPKTTKMQQKQQQKGKHQKS